MNPFDFSQYSFSHLDEPALTGYQVIDWGFNGDEDVVVSIKQNDDYSVEVKAEAFGLVSRMKLTYETVVMSTAPESLLNVTVHQVIEAIREASGTVPHPTRPRPEVPAEVVASLNPRPIPASVLRGMVRESARFVLHRG